MSPVHPPPTDIRASELRPFDTYADGGEPPVKVAAVDLRGDTVLITGVQDGADVTPTFDRDTVVELLGRGGPTLSPVQVAGSNLEDFVLVSDQHSLHWQTPSITDPDLLIRVAVGTDLRLFDDDLIGNLAAVLPDTSGVIVAREYTGCLYVFLPHWTHQRIREGGMMTGRPLTLGERNDTAAAVLAVLAAGQPDELSVLAHKTSAEVTTTVPAMGEPVEYDYAGGPLPLTSAPYRIRAWWD